MSSRPTKSSTTAVRIPPRFEIQNRIRRLATSRWSTRSTRAGNSVLYVQLDNADHEIGMIWRKVTEDNDLPATLEVGSGKSVGLSTYMQTIDSDVADDFSEAMTVSA